MEQIKGFTYTPASKTAWDNLSLAGKAEMMKVAVRNGITDLATIRQKYNEFAEGGDTKDTWTMEDEAKYREWRQSLPDNLRLTNGADYDMRAAFKAGMQPTLEADGYYHLGSRDPQTGRILKAPHHPTYLQALNTDARMGYYPRVDSKGQTYTQTWRGNKFDGITNNTGQMQIGLNVTNGWQPYTLDQILANAERIQQQRQAIEDAFKESQVEPNDNAWVEQPLTYKKKNPHLERKAVEGAKAHAAWEKQHPNLTAWGNVLGAAPLAVAAYPLAATAGSGIAALGDAAAATTVGQGLTNFLAPVATSTIAGAPALEWANVGLSSLSAAHGASQAIEDGGISPMTAFEMAPILQIAKPIYGQTNRWIDNSTSPKMQYVRYGLGKARGWLEGDVPQLPQLYRKVKGTPAIEDGRVILSTPDNRFAFENGLGQESPLITNFTTDVGVRRHADGNWNWAPTLSFPGESLLGKRVISTRPSDTFTYGDKISVPIDKVTAITGRDKEIGFFGDMGLKTLSSSDAQVAYTKDLADYIAKAQKIRANNAKILKAKAEGKPTFKRKWPEKDFDNYASEIQKLTRDNFRNPTVKDYEFMDYVFNPQYGSEVVPKLTLEDAISKYPSLVGSWFGDSGRRRYISNPDEWVNVMYDPYSPAEALFRKSKGIDLKPEWQNK